MSSARQSRQGSARRSRSVGSSEWTTYLTDVLRLDVRIEYELGNPTRYSFQLSGYVDGEWVNLVRYDTAHGFAHADLFHPKGKPTKILLPKVDFNEALTLAQEDINRNWERYLARYRQGRIR